MTVTAQSSTVKGLIARQREFFATGKPKEVEFRLQQLQKLKEAIQNQEASILKALKADLNKPEFEGLFELVVIKEINYALKNLKTWVKPKKVKVPIEQFPAVGKIYPDPLGVVLIISPWNYPFSLAISPLIGAIAAGNCALVKPSEISTHTSNVLAEIISQTFDPRYVAVVEGGKEITQELLAEKFDHIFFTGGTKVGQIVMEAAAKHLTPVTLELGGKSPCIVEPDINIKEAARRIAWGKFANAGQTCIAPDYLLVNSQVKPELIRHLKEAIKEFYGDDPASSPDYVRIINNLQWERLTKLLEGVEIIVGGQKNQSDRYIAPTLVNNVYWGDLLMQEEIFGPILPIVEYTKLEEALALINSRPKPLALYLFSQDKNKQQQVLRNTSSGGVCLNDTLMQGSLTDLPFGGVGDSGIGRYHGKASFDTFSHEKSVLEKTFWFELNWRYAPYQGKVELLKSFLK